MKRSASPGGKGVWRKRQRPLASRELAQTARAFTTLRTRPNFHMVGQTAYQSENMQRDWEPLPPVGFAIQKEGIILEGINLGDALNLRYSYLCGRDDEMFTDESIGISVSCRVEFMEHCVSNYRLRQIATKNYKKQRGPITRQKLAYEVAKIVKEYLKKGETPFHIKFEDMFLVALHHVSKASWQPEIWYRPSSTSS